MNCLATVNVVQMRGITKTFGAVVANHKVDLDIRQGEILSLLGENGSGKTTLMNMLSGIYFPDEGEIAVNGHPVTIRSPKDAFDLGIGMVHQHFKLVDVFTAAENVALGLKNEGRLDLKAVSGRIREICAKYGFQVDPDQKIYDMSVSQKQTVEIIKVLYRGADILILDEPTPQETDRLFDVLRNMKADGKSVVIITHKLHEVMAISDRVAVLRKGEYIGDVATQDTDPQKLTDMMVGRAVTLNIERPVVEKRNLRLEVRHVTVLSDEGVKALDDVSFEAYGGEILGIAGISGSGQKELLEAIEIPLSFVLAQMEHVGFYVDKGSIEAYGRELEQQEQALREEVSERQEKLAILDGIKKELRGIDNFSVESIGDIAYAMENKKNMQKLHAILLITGIPLGIIQWTSIVLWITMGIWWPFAAYWFVAIPYAVWVSNFYFRRVVYICPQCHEVFKPNFKEAFWARHTPTLRKLTCTCCGYHGFCVETYGKEEKENG